MGFIYYKLDQLLTNCNLWVSYIILMCAVKILS